MNSALLRAAALAACALGASARGAGPGGTNGPPAVALDALLADTNLWMRAPADFIQLYRAARWRWVTADVRARSTHPGLSLHGTRVWEALAEFAGGAPRQVVLSLYNRGDAGDLGSETFKKLLDDAARALGDWAGSPSGPTADVRGPGNVKLYRRTWARPPHLAVLEWSFTPPKAGEAFRAEFVRPNLTRTAVGGPVATMLQPTSMPRGPLLSSIDLRKRVQRKDDGDVYVDGVPMVDQGEKGYCAAAVTERVMRYFGREFDQHQAAQIASTTAQGGTSLGHLAESVRRIATKLDLNFRTLFEFGEAKDYIDLFKDYNRVADRQSKPKVQYGGLVINVPEIFAQMEGPVLKEARTARGPDLDRFLQQVKDSVQTGVPLLWACQLGLFKETPDLRQSRGGHMRMIVGYNEKKGEILYSDTWGAGHELKRLPAAEACAMTTGLYAVVPRGIR